MKKFLALFFLLTSVAAAQGVRIGPNNVLQQATVSGVSNVVVTASSPIIHFCQYPANAVPCTNYATTYTDPTLGTACSTSTQIVLDGTNTCVANPDQFTNWGVWVAPGTYAYTITLSNGANLGPYWVSTGSGSGTTCPQGSPFSVQAANSITSTCTGVGPGGAGQQLVFEGTGTPPIAASPGLTDSINSPISTTPYTLAADTGGITLVDRAHSERAQTGASVITIPLSSATGVPAFVTTVLNDSTSILTFNVTNPDTVSIFGGIGGDAATTFKLYPTQSLTLHQAASGIWIARISTPLACATIQKTETGADAALLTCTPPTTTGSYRLRIVLSLSAANTATLGWTATYHDSNGNAQAPTNLSFIQQGTAAPALTFTTSAAGNYYGEAQVDTDNGGTNIIIKLTFSGTSFTGKATATIERIL